MSPIVILAIVLIVSLASFFLGTFFGPKAVKVAESFESSREVSAARSLIAAEAARAKALENARKLVAAAPPAAVTGPAATVTGPAGA
jgi:hypothetical protein